MRYRIWKSYFIMSLEKNSITYDNDIQIYSHSINMYNMLLVSSRLSGKYAILYYCRLLKLGFFSKFCIRKRRDCCRLVLFVEG